MQVPSIYLDNVRGRMYPCSMFDSLHPSIRRAHEDSARHRRSLWSLLPDPAHCSIKPARCACLKGRVTTFHRDYNASEIFIIKTTTSAHTHLISSPRNIQLLPCALLPSSSRSSARPSPPESSAPGYVHRDKVITPSNSHYRTCFFPLAIAPPIQSSPYLLNSLPPQQRGNIETLN